MAEIAYAGGTNISFCWQDKGRNCYNISSQIVEQVIDKVDDKESSNFKKDNPAHSLIASKPFPFATYHTFPLWHVYAITPIALWLIPPENAFSHSYQGILYF